MAPRSRTDLPVRTRPPGRRREDPRPSALNRYLLDSETLVFAVRRHGAVLAGSTSLYLLLLAVSALLLGFANGSSVIATAGLVVLLGASAWFAWKVGDWWVERFTVTDRRVLLVSGLLTRRVAIMPLRKVTDLTFERSLLGRLCGYGAFVMESAGQQQALSRVDFLPRPESLYLQMSDLLFGSGEADHDPDEDGHSRTGRPRRRAGANAGASTRAGVGPGARPRPPLTASATTGTATVPRVTSRPPLVPPPPARPAPASAPASVPAGTPATDRTPAPPGASHRVSSSGSPPATSATAPLPSIARDRPLARRPRGRQGAEPGEPHDRDGHGDMA